MAAAGVVQSKPAERLILALLLSVLVHLALILAIPAQRSNPRVKGSSPITAMLEPLASIEAPQIAASEPEATAPMVAEPPPASAENPPALQQRDPAAIESQAEQQPSEPKPGEAAPLLEIPVSRDPTYYAVSLLDEYPRPLRPVEPRYPQQATSKGISGTVTLLLLIDEAGKLDEISVVQAKPEGIFDEAAIAAFRDMRFSPARKDGRAVRSRVRITVGFEAK